MLSTGLALIFLALNLEIVSQLTWNPSMLGAGISVIALAIALYALLIHRERKVEVIKSTNAEGNMSDSKGSSAVIYLLLVIVGIAFLAYRLFNRVTEKQSKN